MGGQRWHGGGELYTRGGSRYKRVRAQPPLISLLQVIETRFLPLGSLLSLI